MPAWQCNVLLLFPSRQMSQRYARVPFLLCKFHAHACSNPGRLSALCPCALPSMYISHMAAAIAEALACGLGLAAV
jgi:hypothetical protein